MRILFTCNPGCGHLDIDVLVTVGPAVDPGALGAVPPNVRLETPV